MGIYLIDDLQKLRKHEEAMDAIALGSVDKTLYVTYDYLYNWCKIFSPNNIRIFVAHEGERVTGFFPFCCRPGAREGSLDYRMMGYGLLGYTDFLIAPGADREKTITEFFEHLYEHGTPGAVHLGPFLSTANSVAALKNYLIQSGKVCFERKQRNAPHIVTQGGHQEYLKTLNGKKLADLNRCRRRLDETGEVTVRIVNNHNDLGADELDRLLDDFFELYFRQWEVNRFKRHGGYFGLYRDFAAGALKKGYIDLSCLYLDGKPLAIHYGFKLNSCRYYFTPTFDFNYRSYSPGRILLFHLIEDAFATGIEFDFQNDAEPYKLEWTQDLQETCSIDVLPPGVPYSNESLQQQLMNPFFRQIP